MSSALTLTSLRPSSTYRSNRLTKQAPQNLNSTRGDQSGNYMDEKEKVGAANHGTYGGRTSLPVSADKDNMDGINKRITTCLESLTIAEGEYTAARRELPAIASLKTAEESKRIVYLYEASERLYSALSNLNEAKANRMELLKKTGSLEYIDLDHQERHKFEQALDQFNLDKDLYAKKAHEMLEGAKWIRKM